MSDISLPPQQPKTQEKKLLENKLLRPLFTFFALIAPFPVLVAVLDLWLTNTSAGANAHNTPFEIIRQILTGAGDPPTWAVLVSMLPSIFVLMILLRTTVARLVAVIALLGFAAGEAFFFMQMNGG